MKWVPVWNRPYSREHPGQEECLQTGGSVRQRPRLDLDHKVVNLNMACAKLDIEQEFL